MMKEKASENFRHLWPLDPEVAYLNHGSYGASPISVLEAQRRFQDELESCPVGLFNFKYWSRIQECVENLARFLGSKSENLVFLENSTSGVSAVLRSAIQKTLKPGDKLLTTSHCYGAVRKAMEYVASISGAAVVEAVVPFPLSLDARTAENQILAAIESSLDSQIRYLIIDHVASASGLIFPLEKILRLCKQRSIPVLVDGAHAPALINLDLEQLGEFGACWYVGNCHKWLCAPKGSAFLWAHPDFQSELHPGTISHGYPKGFRDEFLWIGTRDPSAWFAVGAALDFIKERGLHFMQQHNNQLCDRAAELFARKWGVERTVPRALLGPMETLAIPGEWPSGELAAQCFMRYLYEKHKIIAQIYPFQDRLWLRISAQLYNSFSQYAGFLDVLSLKNLSGVRAELDSRIRSANSL